VKNQLVPPWVTFQSFKNLKIESGEDDVVKSIMPLLFTKMAQLGVELQKCHYWASNVAHSLR